MRSLKLNFIATVCCTLFLTFLSFETAFAQVGGGDEKKNTCMYDGMEYSVGSVKEMAGEKRTCTIDSGNHGEAYWK